MPTTPADPGFWSLLPTPLAFIGGVLFLGIWFVKALTELIRTWNDTARSDLATERAEKEVELAAERRKREEVEADAKKITLAMQQDIADLRDDVEKLRDQLTTDAREAHAKHIELIRENASLRTQLAERPEVPADPDPTEDI